MKIVTLLGLVMIWGLGLSQSVSFEKKDMAAVPLFGTYNISLESTPFTPLLEKIEAPSPDGNAEKRFLASQKTLASRLFPVRSNVSSERSAIDGPEIISDFGGNAWTSFTPLDNHLAVNFEENIVSTVNVHMVVLNESGFWLSNTTLDNFFGGITAVDRFFDPRIIFDPVEDRFIMVLMNGSICEDSELLFAFSQTSDPSGEWNLYKMEGCPFENSTFADYPMISITDDELFFTYNGVDQSSSWQAGFVATHIIQIDKTDGYSGEPLDSRFWSAIQYEGKNIRNICPVKNADETMPENVYFLSNRNFDIENDTFFLVEIDGKLGDEDATLAVKTVLADQPYGIPPNALQPQDSLQTNDARVLDAFLHNDEIQFVNNTMNFENGLSGVYHGVISNVSSSPSIAGNILTNEDNYMGYPGLAYTGLNPEDRDAIIVASHSRADRNPGFSALYYDGAGQYSNWLTVKEGDRHIDILDGTLERWGDYSGIQRFYSQPGMVYASSSFGKFNRTNDTWVAKISRPEMNVSTNDLYKNHNSISAYPLPAQNWINIEFKLPHKQWTALITDLQGKVLFEVYSSEGSQIQDDIVRLHFNTSTLLPGNYTVQIVSEAQIVATKLITIQ